MRPNGLELCFAKGGINSASLSSDKIGSGTSAYGILRHPGRAIVSAFIAQLNPTKTLENKYYNEHGAWRSRGYSLLQFVGSLRPGQHCPSLLPISFLRAILFFTVTPCLFRLGTKGKLKDRFLLRSIAAAILPPFLHKVVLYARHSLKNPLLMQRWIIETWPRWMLMQGYPFLVTLAAA